MPKVLCLARTWVERNIAEGFTRHPDTQILGRGFESIACGWIEKADAETRYSHKQVCTYAVLRRDGKVMTYIRGRAGDEKGLHHRMSIGVGGHVEVQDQGARIFPSLQTVYQAALREMHEEVVIDGTVNSFRLYGLIDTNDDDVGKKHLGLVYLVDIRSDARVRSNDPSIVSPSFVVPSVALASVDDYERWSQVALKDLVEADI